MPTMEAIRPSKLAGTRVSGIRKLNTSQVPTPNTTENKAPWVLARRQKAPATSGPEEFDRYFRVQMNTMEGLIQFLPSLWIFALFGNEQIGAVLGLIWIVGRILYALAYVKDPATRGRGFMIAGLSMLALQLGGLYFVIMGLIQNGI